MGNSMDVAHCASEGDVATPPDTSAAQGAPLPEATSSDSLKPAGDLDKNPGPYEDLHKLCRDVFPMSFDGAKIVISKGLSNRFQISHTLNMSPASNGYRFGVTYVGTKQTGPAEAFPVLLGDTDVLGNVNAQAVHQFSDRVRCRLLSQIEKSKIKSCQLTTEYRLPLSTASLTIANPDLVGGNGVLVGSYLHRITPRIDAGVELQHHYGAYVPGGSMTVLSYCGRYLGDCFTSAASVSRSSLHASYYHKQQENLQIGVEWETDFRVGGSIAKLGYQIELPKANVTFRGSVDSQWAVAATMEKKLMPLPFTLALSGQIDHVKATSKFGIGLIIG